MDEFCLEAIHSFSSGAGYGIIAEDSEMRGVFDHQACEYTAIMLQVAACDFGRSSRVHLGIWEHHAKGNSESCPETPERRGVPVKAVS